MWTERVCAMGTEVNRDRLEEILTAVVAAATAPSSATTPSSISSSRSVTHFVL